MYRLMIHSYEVESVAWNSAALLVVKRVAADCATFFMFVLLLSTTSCHGCIHSRLLFYELWLDIVQSCYPMKFASCVPAAVYTQRFLSLSTWSLLIQKLQLELYTDWTLVNKNCALVRTVCITMHPVCYARGVLCVTCTGLHQLQHQHQQLNSDVMTFTIYSDCAFLRMSK